MINIKEIYLEYMENAVDTEEKKDVDNKLKQALFVLSNLIDDAEATAEEQGFINGYKQARLDLSEKFIVSPTEDGDFYRINITKEELFTMIQRMKKMGCPENAIKMMMNYLIERV